VFNLTLHTRGSMAGVTHVEGDVTATFVISPLQGPGVVYTGTYREHDVGNFADGTIDIPHPSSSFYLHATGTGTDGSQIRCTLRGHLTSEPVRSAGTSCLLLAASADHRRGPERHRRRTMGLGAAARRFVLDT